ncbi:GIY-YIG nuclease family protein [Bacteroidota bacterium]
MVEAKLYYVHAISSLSRTYIYVGLIINKYRRIDEHQKDYNKTTRANCPFKIILVKKYQTRQEARKREKYLKSGIGKEFLKTIK